MRTVWSAVIILLGLVSCATCTVRAATLTYDLAIKVAAQTLAAPPAPSKVSVTVTGTMTYNDVTGEVSFQVSEKGGVDLSGTGLMGIGPKLQTIANTTYVAGPPSSPFYTGTAFSTGKFSKDKKKFSGKFYAVCDSFGAPPQGYTFNTGTMKATLKP